MSLAAARGSNSTRADRRNVCACSSMPTFEVHGPYRVPTYNGKAAKIVNSYDARVSRAVLQEAAGETPSVYLPSVDHQKCARVVAIRCTR